MQSSIQSAPTTTSTKMSATKQSTKEVCGICLESLKFNRRNIHETKCGHKFHACCFRKITDTKCPYCRREVDHEPVRKLRMLQHDLANIQYEEQHNTLQMVNYMDLDITSQRVDHLRQLLQKELEEKRRIQAIIRNTNMYYKYKKQEIKNRIKIVRVDIGMNLAVKKQRQEMRRRERALAAALDDIETESESETDLDKMMEDLMNESIVSIAANDTDNTIGGRDDVVEEGFTVDYYNVFSK